MSNPTLLAPNPLEVTPPTTAAERHWRVPALAAFIGLSRQRVYMLIKEGRLRVRYVGGRMVVPDSSVVEYLESCPTEKD